MLDYQETIREKYKYIILAFRFLFFLLGLFLTNFCTKGQLNPLPAPFNIPAVIFIVLVVYEVIASFFTLKFILEKIALFFVIAADVIFGVALTYFFGVNFFAVSCIFPIIEVAAFLGFLWALAAIAVILMIYFPLLGFCWNKYQKLNAGAYLEAFQAQIRVYFLMTVVILVFFFRLFKTETEISKASKEALKIKQDADKEIADMKREIKQLCNEVGHKQDAVERLQTEVKGKTKELKEVEERLQEIMYEGQELLNIAQAKEEKSVEELKRQSGKIKHRLDYLEERVSNLTKLINIYQRLNLSAHMEETYSNIMKTLLEIMPSQTILIFILKIINKKLRLSCEAAVTPYKSYFEDLYYDMGESIIGWSAENKKTLVVGNGAMDVGGEELSTLIAYEKSAVVVPLVHNDNILGVIYLGRVQPEAFSQEEVERVNLFCKLLCVALKFVKEYHMDISSGVKDDTTNLYTSYYFKERLKDEVERAKRYDYPTSLIVLGLDNFNAVRQKYNSLIVNSALKEIGELLISHCRATDVVGRFGDEEFTLLLIQTTKNEAILIAERLRMSLGVRIFGKTFGEKINIQASIGLSVYRQEFDSADDFLDEAQTALAKARQKGGNTTVISSN